MKRIKVLGLCLVAVFALSAVIVSGASAALPEYQICGKTTKNAEKKYTGKYSEKTCGKEASEAEQLEGKHNKYERVAWTNAKKTTFKGKNSGNPHNNIVNPFGKEKKVGEPGQVEGTTECTKEKVAGSVTGPKETKWKTEYSKCEGLGTACTTDGAKKAGVINTDELESTLVNLDGTTPHKRVGIRVKGLGPGGRLAQYKCLEGGINIEVFGEILAEVKGNLNVANKMTEDVAAEGPKKLQGVGGTYVEEAPFGPASEEAAKGWWEYNEGLKACEAGEPPFPPGPHSQAECELFLGGPNPVPVKPVLLESVVTGLKSGDAPGIQNGTSLIKGEAFLIAEGAPPPPPSGTVAGTVTETPAKPSAGAIVSMCRTPTNCYSTETKGDGTYEIKGATVGNYVARVSPPVNSPDGEVTSTAFSVTENATTTENFTLLAPTPPPPGTAVVGNRAVEVNGEEYPQIFWQTASPLSTQACKGGTVTAEVIAVNTQTGMPEATEPVDLLETSPNSGTFEGSLPPVFPLHGEGRVVISPTDCSLASEEEPVEFTIYIDPSGEVVDGNNGNAALAEATVTLERSTSEMGTFTMVPNGSPIMALSNRVNSDSSSPAGLFGWDVAEGAWYKVVAKKEGCGETASAAYFIGAPVTELKLVLACTPVLEITTPSLEEGTRGKPYSQKLTAVNGLPPYKWKKVMLPKGLKINKETGELFGTPKESLAEGEYTVKVKVSDSGKKGTKQTKEKEFKLKLK